MKDFQNIKIIITYDGTNYHGWQKQTEKKSIQGTIGKAIQGITGEPEIKLYGSGRTDAGVHAIGQVANFYTQFAMPIDKWPIALNHQLPSDIKIRYAKKVNSEFHARYSAKSKIYRYYIMNAVCDRQIITCKKIFLRNYCYFFNQKLDINYMKKIAGYIIGYHDFSALSCLNQKKDQIKKNKRREIKDITIRRKNNLICFSIEADSFLYKMVRVIVGTLLDFSLNQRKPEEFLQLIKKKDNQKSGKVVPAQGLYLVKVKY